MSEEIYIVAARRTPIGAFQGVLSAATAPQLGATAARAAIDASGLAAERIQETVLGCVLMAGIGQAPARQAALAAGVPQSVPATTVNKMCGSALKALMIASDEVRAGSADIILAGGIESMSNAPYLLPKARAGLRMGHAELIDHMFFDGLQSPFDGKLMGFSPMRRPRSTGSRESSKMSSPRSRFAARCARSNPVRSSRKSPRSRSRSARASAS